MPNDYKIDGDDQLLLFKSSDKKFFTIGRERASQSEVWKAMLDLENKKGDDGESIDGELIDGELIDGEPIDGELIDGEPIDGELIDEEIIESKAIHLEEKAKVLVIFFKALLPSKWERHRLKVEQVIEILRMSDKYQAPTAAFFISCTTQIDDRSKWPILCIFDLYYYAALFRLGSLRDLAVTNFISLRPFEEWNLESFQTEQLNISTFQIMELVRFKQKWSQRIRDYLSDYQPYCQQRSCRPAWIGDTKRLSEELDKSLFRPSPELCSSHSQTLFEAYHKMLRELNEIIN